MIAVDTSSLIAYLRDVEGPDIPAVDQALAMQLVVLPPVVLTEILSAPALDAALAALILELPLLEVTAGYWRRAARSRARVLARGRRAPLADALISQSCLDHQVPLITRDADFVHFRDEVGLVLA